MKGITMTEAKFQEIRRVTKQFVVEVGSVIPEGHEGAGTEEWVFYMGYDTLADAEAGADECSTGSPLVRILQREDS